LEHPAVSVIRGEAQAFCLWLTEKESNAGRLPKGAVYRLPTEVEWHFALGQENKEEFLWGKELLPPEKVGNFADESFQKKFPPKGPGGKWIEGYDDGFATTAPVGSFPANKYGIYDMIGNVWEWCEDSFDGDSGMLLGSSWNDGDTSMLRPDWRSIAKPGLDRYNMYGFRCVLVMPAP
jgi:formylglycine-generating enzyme required for sulfatase activity